jgi:hypothetical protein
MFSGTATGSIDSLAHGACPRWLVEPCEAKDLIADPRIVDADVDGADTAAGMLVPVPTCSGDRASCTETRRLQKRAIRPRLRRDLARAIYSVSADSSRPVAGGPATPVGSAARRRPCAGVRRTVPVLPVSPLPRILERPIWLDDQGIASENNETQSFTGGSQCAFHSIPFHSIPFTLLVSIVFASQATAQPDPCAERNRVIFTATLSQDWAGFPDRLSINYTGGGGGGELSGTWPIHVR